MFSKRKNDEGPRAQLNAAVIIFIVLAGILFVGAIVLEILEKTSPIDHTVPKIIQVAPIDLTLDRTSFANDTASPIYVTSRYHVDMKLPLGTWQSVTVYGETFKACVVEQIGSYSILSVSPTEAYRCATGTSAP